MELVWVQANWIVLAAAGGGFLLLVLVILASLHGGKDRAGRKSAGSRRATPSSEVSAGPRSAVTGARPLPRPVAAPPSAASTESAAPELASDWSRLTWDDWKKPSGEPANVEVSPAGLRIGPGEGAVSVGCMPVTPGAAFVCEFDVQLASPASNGQPVNFYVGPITRDAAGNVVGWWVEQAVFGAGETTRAGVVEATASPGAVTAHVGIHGSAKPDGAPLGDGVLLVTALRLRAV